MSALLDKIDVTITELSDKPNDPSKYNEALKKLCTIATASELGYILTHLPSFVDANPFNVNMFKTGINPSWEDAANVKGCSWSIQCKPEQANAIFERLSIYYAMKGFSKFSCNGISVNVRKNFAKFSVWSRNVPSVTDGADVHEELKDAFGFDLSVEFIYKNHRDLLDKITAYGNAPARE